MVRSLFRVQIGGGVIAPQLPSLPHLELFLRSDQGVFSNAALTIPASNGGVVGGWQDMSGNVGRDTIISVGLNNPPLYTASITPTGKPAVRFFGAQGTNNQGQLLGNLPVGGLGSARGYTYYLWINELTLNAPKPISNTQTVFAAEIANGIRLIPDDWSFSAGHNVVFGVIGNANALGIQRWAVVYHAPTDGSAQIHDLTVNGITVSNTSGLPMNLNTSYIISGNGGGNVCFDGYVGAILVYTDQHSLAQQALVLDFLTKTFG
jgi:hypothetical protein